MTAVEDTRLAHAYLASTTAVVPGHDRGHRSPAAEYSCWGLLSRTVHIAIGSGLMPVLRIPPTLDFRKIPFTGKAGNRNEAPGRPRGGTFWLGGGRYAPDRRATLLCLLVLAVGAPYSV